MTITSAHDYESIIPPSDALCRYFILVFYFYHWLDSLFEVGWFLSGLFLSVSFSECFDPSTLVRTSRRPPLCLEVCKWLVLWTADDILWYKCWWTLINQKNWQPLKLDTAVTKNNCFRTFENLFLHQMTTAKTLHMTFVCYVTLMVYECLERLCFWYKATLTCPLCQVVPSCRFTADLLFLPL
jgi:hypothetical protein